MLRSFALLRLLLAIAWFATAGSAMAHDDDHHHRHRAPPVILDTDFNTIGDDGQVLAMAAQLDARGAIDLLGITVASGNQWLAQGVSDALKAVERLGIERRVKVYAGAPFPLIHDDKAYALENKLFGPAVGYTGALGSPPPTSSSHLVAPADGFATHTRPSRRHAVDFIIDAVRRHPHEVTILAIAPPTNLALAIRKAPDIVPLIKQIVTMAGQVDVPGNAFLNNAEFNWWFDPEATQIVLRADIPRVIVPLDCTNTLPLTKAVYRQIADHRPQTPITRLFANEYAPFFGSGPPPFDPFVFDTVALAVLVEPSLVTEARDLWLDVRTTFDRNYGVRVNELSALDPERSVGLLHRSKVVFRIDSPRFYAWFAELLTAPVPVRDGDGDDDRGRDR